MLCVVHVFGFLIMLDCIRKNTKKKHKLAHHAKASFESEDTEV